MSESPGIRRILVALDASPGSLAAAAAAAELAALLDAELRGLFVEDTDLLRLAESPLAREMDFLTASPRGLASGTAEGQLRVHARQARAALVRLAARRGVPWTFRVARGSVVAEILAAAAEVDLVSLGRIGWSMRQGRTLGSTARALIARRRGRVLMLERPAAARAVVVVVYAATAAGREALELAATLARLRGEPLSVLLVGEEEDRLRSEVAERLAGESVDVFVTWHGLPQPHSLARAVGRRMGGLVVMPVVPQVLAEEHLQALLDGVECPVLAVS